MDENTNTRKLVKGNTLHQIYAYGNFLFSVSSTLEKLYRYKFDPSTNEVVEIVVFKRVRAGEHEMKTLSGLTPANRSGSATPFENKRYDVYPLIYNKLTRGYMLFARMTYGYGQATASERMYFAFEKYEKKGR